MKNTLVKYEKIANINENETAMPLSYLTNACINEVKITYSWVLLDSDPAYTRQKLRPCRPQQT
jgi:hypothetical protein